MDQVETTWNSVWSHKTVIINIMIAAQLCNYYVRCTLILVMLIETYTKSAHAAASIYAFPWMGPKSTTSFILIVRSFTCRPNHDMGPIFYLCTDPQSNFRFKQGSNPRPLSLKSTTITTRPREQTGMIYNHITHIY